MKTESLLSLAAGISASGGGSGVSGGAAGGGGAGGGAGGGGMNFAKIYELNKQTNKQTIKHSYNYFYSNVYIKENDSKRGRGSAIIWNISVSLPILESSVFIYIDLYTIRCDIKIKLTG